MASSSAHSSVKLSAEGLFTPRALQKDMQYCALQHKFIYFE